jgi:HNH endonuclease
MSSGKVCIYCAQTDVSRFYGVEHVIPQGFGTFDSKTPTLNCVCDDCNSYFGRELDQLLTRETPEGVLRYSRGHLSSEARLQKRLNLTLADPLEAGEFAGLRVAVDGTTGRLMPPAAQFHIHNFQTGKDEVYFLSQIAGLTLKEVDYGKPGTSNEKGTWRCKILAPSREAHDEMVETLQGIGIDFKPGAAFQNPWSAESTEQLSFLVKAEAEFDKPHKRALAKILMNFVAFYLGCEEALAPRWDLLRRYVRFGEGEMKARISHRARNGHVTDQLRFPDDDSINVRITNLDGHIVGAIQFYCLHIYEMILAEKDSLRADQEIGIRYIPGEPPLRVAPEIAAGDPDHSED